MICVRSNLSCVWFTFPMILLCEALVVSWSVLLFFVTLLYYFLLVALLLSFVFSPFLSTRRCIRNIILASPSYIQIARIIHFGFCQNRNRSNGCFLRARRQPRHGTTEPRCQNPMAHGNATHPLATGTLPRIRRHPC